MEIVYISENKIFFKNSGQPTELSSQRVEKYKKALESINKRSEWKTSGKGAQFTGSYAPSGEIYAAAAYISGLSKYEDGFLYSINLDGVGGIYKKTTHDDYIEGHVTAKDKLQIRDINIKGNKCTASVGSSDTRNLAVFALPSGGYEELTEGDTREDFPSFSMKNNRILFSSAGLARYPNGAAVVGPYAAMVFELDSGEMNELFYDENFDFIRVKEDAHGNIYYIKRPYGNEKNENILLDIILFPWRMIKAIFGFFNYFSVIFGGQSLRNNKDPRVSANMKMKQKSERELFIDGNVINAERVYNANKQKGEKYPGLIPHSWELIKIDAVSGEKVCIKKGVLDYTICEDGSILYSNGHAIVKITGTKEELVEKCRLANSMIII
ncbi:MAG: hypothetical protein FWG70_01530 [Oscillospiraceae bacterium]|nr:hypothetical protein [Oscillospiraceae bacterium]